MSIPRARIPFVPTPENSRVELFKAIRDTLKRYGGLGVNLLIQITGGGDFVRNWTTGDKDIVRTYDGETVIFKTGAPINGVSPPVVQGTLERQEVAISILGSDDVEIERGLLGVGYGQSTLNLRFEFFGPTTAELGDVQIFYGILGGVTVQGTDITAVYYSGFGQIDAQRTIMATDDDQRAINLTDDSLSQISRGGHVIWGRKD